MTLVSEKPKNAKNVSKEREREREEEGGRVKKKGGRLCRGRMPRDIVKQSIWHEATEAARETADCLEGKHNIGKGAGG